MYTCTGVCTHMHVLHIWGTIKIDIIDNGTFMNTLAL